MKEYSGRRFILELSGFIEGFESLRDYTYSGCVDLLIELNFRAQLSIEITPGEGVGGNWSGTLDPDIIGPGEELLELCIQVQNLHIGNLPQGQHISVATITLYAAPAP